MKIKSSFNSSRLMALFLLHYKDIQQGASYQDEDNRKVGCRIARVLESTME